jgi:hypothetical protein
MFDSTLLRRYGFSGWSNEQLREVEESDYFFYRQGIMPGYAAYTRGVQIVRPGRPKKTIFIGITDRWFG